MKLFEAKVESAQGYYVGDAYHVLHDDAYNTLADVMSDSDSVLGCFEDKASGKSLLWANMMMFHGGEVHDLNGNAYTVKSSNICLIPLEMVAYPEGLFHGRVFKVPGMGQLVECDSAMFKFVLPDSRQLQFRF